MQCNKCGHEEFRVVRTIRNKVRQNGIWNFNAKRDTRLLICRGCGRQFLEVSFISSELVYDKNKGKMLERNISDGQFYLFEDAK